MKISLSRFLLILAYSLVIASCSNKLKHQVGMVTTGPNEYAITRNKPLEVPPHFDLETIEKEKGLRESSSENLDYSKKNNQNLNAAELELLQTVQQQ